MDKSSVLQWLTSTGVVPVVRIKDGSRIMDAAEALISGGVNIMEVTMSSTKPFEVIDRLKSKYGDKLMVGLGSVLKAETAIQGIDAGAEFIVSPVFEQSILDSAQSRDTVTILGALTPTEIQHAFSAGTDIVKVFPATTFGPKYFTDILAPMPHLRLTPTGGVNLSNVGDFMAAGAACVGVGSALLNEEIIQNSRWNDLSQLAKQYCTEVEQGRLRRKS